MDALANLLPSSPPKYVDIIHTYLHSQYENVTHMQRWREFSSAIWTKQVGGPGVGVGNR